MRDAEGRLKRLPSHDPADLPPGDHWRRACPHPGCLTITQGGMAGLDAHVIVVHGPGWGCTDA